jgi:hypothetical protein
MDTRVYRMMEPDIAMVLTRVMVKACCTELKLVATAASIRNMSRCAIITTKHTRSRRTRQEKSSLHKPKLVQWLGQTMGLDHISQSCGWMLTQVPTAPAAT